MTSEKRVVGTNGSIRIQETGALARDQELDGTAILAGRSAICVPNRMELYSLRKRPDIFSSNLPL